MHVKHIHSHVGKEQEGRENLWRRSDRQTSERERRQGIKRLPLLNLCKEGVFSFCLPPHVSRYIIPLSDSLTSTYYECLYMNAFAVIVTTSLNHFRHFGGLY